jgi:hypothetical protein
VHAFRKRVLKPKNDLRKKMEDKELAFKVTPEEFKFRYAKRYEEECYKPRESDATLEIIP